MSMRIESQTDTNIPGNVRSAGTRTAGSESAAGYAPVKSSGPDKVSLSMASGLVSLAKGMMPADKQAKVAVLASQVRSGQYDAEASQISRSIVQSYLNN